MREERRGEDLNRKGSDWLRIGKERKGGMKKSTKQMEIIDYCTWQYIEPNNG